MTPHGCYLVALICFILAAAASLATNPKIARLAFPLLAAGLALYVLPAAVHLHA